MNRKFTDLFIGRPVLAVVVSLVILVIGLRSVGLLPVLQYPYTQNAVVTVSTVYPGADANLVASFITTPLENAIAQANGIDTMTSSSVQNGSTITANLRLNYDSDKALTEINTKVNSVLNQLPPQSQKPMLSVSIGQTISAMYIGFYSDVLAPNQITDYLTRSVQPKLQSVDGVQTAQILGAKNFALRAWLEPQELAATGSPPPTSTPRWRRTTTSPRSATPRAGWCRSILSANTGLHSLDDFRNMVVKSSRTAQVVRLRGRGRGHAGFGDYDSSSRRSTARRRSTSASRSRRRRTCST